MAPFPTTWPALLALAVIVGGLALAVARRYPWSYTMGLVCIGVFAIQTISPSVVRCALYGMRMDCVAAELSFISPLLPQGERVLTPFTYMFVHADLLHLAGNMFILLTAGPALEERIGSRNFLILYVLAGLGAAAASFGLWRLDFFAPEHVLDPNVGASGAIFGVLTGFAVLFPRERLPMIMPFMFFVMWMPAFTVLLLYLALNLVYIFINTNIAWWGHFAGFLVGLALAPLLHKHLPKRTVSKALAVDTDALRPIATTNVQRSALRELERLANPQTLDDRQLAQVWWDRFVSHAHCPVCQSKLEEREGALACPRGDYEVRAMRP